MDLLGRIPNCYSMEEASDLFQMAEEWMRQNGDTNEKLHVMIAFLENSDKLGRFLPHNIVCSRITACLEYLVNDFEFTSALHFGAKQEIVLIMPIVISHLKKNIQAVFATALELDPLAQRKDSQKTWMDSLLACHDMLLNSRRPDDTKNVNTIRLIPFWLLDATCTTITKAENMIAKDKDVNLSFITYVVFRSRNMLLKDGRTFLKAICDDLLRQEESPIRDRIYERIFTDVSFGMTQAESILEGLMTTISTPLDLRRLIGLTGTKLNTIQYKFIRKLLFQRTPDPKLVKILITYLTSSITRREIFPTLLDEAVCIWSDAYGVANSPTPLLVHRTRVLLQLGTHAWKYCATSDLESLFQKIAIGVEKYMKRPERSIVCLGILMAEESAKWNGDPVGKLDEIDVEIEKLREELQGAFITEEKSHAKKTSRMEYPILETQRPMTLPTPLDSDDDEDFAPFSVHTLEAVQEAGPSTEVEPRHPQPTYLAECLEWLDENDNRPKWIAAIKDIERFIRIKLMDNSEDAPIVLRKLVFLENKFCYPNFDEYRLKCITNLIVHFPSLAPTVADYVICTKGHMKLRYDLLACIHSAAVALANGTYSLQENAKKTPRRQLQNVPEWRRIIDERVQGKTRYIGTRLTKNVDFSKTTINRLAPDIEYFTYPLIRTDAQGAHQGLMGYDSQLLACCLMTVAAIIELAPNTLSLPRICGALSSLADNHSVATEPYMRISVLAARLSIVKSLPVEVFFEKFSSVLQRWIKWGTNIVDNQDCDEVIQKAAKELVSMLVQIARSQNV